MKIHLDDGGKGNHPCGEPVIPGGEWSSKDIRKVTCVRCRRSLEGTEAIDEFRRDILRRLDEVWLDNEDRQISKQLKGIISDLETMF